MPRGRYWYGPGFWKDASWHPVGGFRGGGFGRGPGWGPGWGPCRWWYGAPGFYGGPAFSGPEDEKAFLKEQAELLKSELAELEQRMSELEAEL